MPITVRFTSIAKIGAVSVLPLILAGCESDEDRAVRIQKAQDLGEVSLQVCDMDSEESQASLTKTLEGLSYKSLFYLEDNDIVVCPDARLTEVENYRRKNRPQSVFYPDDNVITFNPDNRYGRGLISRFTSKYDTQKLSELNDVQMGVRYSTGKATARRWRNDASEYSVFQENPQLLEPPTR